MRAEQALRSSNCHNRVQNSGPHAVWGLAKIQIGQCDILPLFNKLPPVAICLYVLKIIDNSNIEFSKWEFESGSPWL